MKRTLILSSRLVVVGSLLSLAIGSVGCSGASASGESTATAAAAQATKVAPVAPQAKTGRVRFVADALSTVPLRDDQRAEIEKLATDADARHATTGTVHAEIITLLAAQVEAGKIDRAALQPKIDAAADAMNGARPADQAAIQRLHAILTPDQRAQFVDAIESRAKAKHAEHPYKSHMDKWAADLQLTDDQKAQIATLLKAQMGEHHGEMKAAHEHGKGFLDSFKSDTLALPPPQDAHVMANQMTDHFLHVVETVLPILTPQQRSLAAAKLREHAAAGGIDEGGPVGE